jgi:hypothetical protein
MWHTQMNIGSVFWNVAAYCGQKKVSREWYFNMIGMANCVWELKSHE